jgi:hypothetical protein
MPTKRITISVSATVASRIKKAAGAARVSSWVTDLIEEHLNDAELERQWQEFYRAVLPSRKDTGRARALLKRLTGGARVKALRESRRWRRF